MSSGRAMGRNAQYGGGGGGGTGNTKLEEAQRKVDDVKGVMHQNIQLTLDRGEKLENMEEKAENLENHASMFQKNATKVKRHFCYQYVKLTILIFLILAVIGLIIGLSIWGSQKKKDDK